MTTTKEKIVIYCELTKYSTESLEKMLAECNEKNNSLCSIIECVIEKRTKLEKINPFFIYFIIDSREPKTIKTGLSNVPFVKLGKLQMKSNSFLKLALLLKFDSLIEARAANDKIKNILHKVSIGTIKKTYFSHVFEF